MCIRDRNMTGVFAGAAITEVLGKWTDGGKLGLGFAMLAIIVLIARGFLLFRYFLDNLFLFGSLGFGREFYQFSIGKLSGSFLSIFYQFLFYRQHGV